MRQRILGSHTPPCHRRMVITTQFTTQLLIVLWLWPSEEGRGEGGLPVAAFHTITVLSA